MGKNKYRSGALKRKEKGEGERKKQLQLASRVPLTSFFLPVANRSEEFVLYMVHESGEKTQLKDNEYLLVARVLYGPCEKISKILITEADLGEEVTHDVAQYIKFEIPVLDSFVKKLKEGEEREINKLTKKYGALRTMIQLACRGHTSDSVSVSV